MSCPDHPQWYHDREDCPFCSVLEIRARQQAHEQQADRRLLQDLRTLFTSTPQEIAERFGESRCTDDSARINYALELLDGRLHPRSSHD